MLVHSDDGCERSVENLHGNHLHVSTLKILVQNVLRWRCFGVMAELPVAGRLRVNGSAMLFRGKVAAIVFETHCCDCRFVGRTATMKKDGNGAWDFGVSMVVNPNRNGVTVKSDPRQRVGDAWVYIAWRGRDNHNQTIPLGRRCTPLEPLRATRGIAIRNPPRIRPVIWVHAPFLGFPHPLHHTVTRLIPAAG